MTSLLPDLVPTAVQTTTPLSAGRKLTQRQRAQIAAGIHPLTGGPVDPNPAHRCGNCNHRVHRASGSRSFPKCDADSGQRITAGPATDVRAYWPACAGSWEPNGDLR